MHAGMDLLKKLLLQNKSILILFHPVILKCSDFLITRNLITFPPTSNANAIKTRFFFSSMVVGDLSTAG